MPCHASLLSLSLSLSVSVFVVIFFPSIRLQRIELLERKPTNHWFTNVSETHTHTHTHTKKRFPPFPSCGNLTELATPKNENFLTKNKILLCIYVVELFLPLERLSNTGNNNRLAVEIVIYFLPPPPASYCKICSTCQKIDRCRASQLGSLAGWFEAN